MKSIEKIIKVSSLTLLFSLLFATLTIGCETKKSESESAENEQLDSAIVQAEATYQQFCSGCHGAVMEAFVDRDWEYGNSPAELRKTISEGRADGQMPAFGKSFSEEKISNLVKAIRYKIEHVDEYEFDDDVNISGTFRSNDLNFKLEEVADGFDSPWGMEFLSNGDILVTDKSGELYRVKSNGDKEEIEGAPEVEYEGQGGLMDIKLHPDFASNSILYLSYSKLNEEDDDLATTAVSRYKLDGNKLTAGELIFEARPYYETRHHYGSRLEFNNNGYLFVTVGDRGRREVNPQDLSLAPGKVHRINDDGSIPADNPFVDKDGAVKSTYSYGHRNPQGMIRNPSTGDIWIHEHGPKGGDEINIIRPGVNYGWPVISYGINYDGTVFTTETEKEGMAQPIHYWVPSIAPSGMDFVRGDKYPGWEGDLMVGSLKYEYLNFCNIDGDNVTSEEKLMKGIGRVRNVKQGPDGFIFVAVEEPGRIYKIVPVK